ncbi:unnamed protein product [Camellia sinensis]
MGGEGSDSQRPNIPVRGTLSSSSSSSFYKIILPSIIHDNKLELRIPKKFAAKYGNELTSIVTLTVPNGRIWHLGVEKADNMLWFHNGWKEFAEHHSISCGFFILFKYEENSKFNVHIFDLTACEIHYPRNTISISEEPSHGKQYPAKDEEEVEFLGVNTCSNSVTRQPVTTQEREKAVNAAMMFKPKNPFFTAILRQYNVHRRCVLYVPANFARNHLNAALKFIELQVSGGKRWKVSCFCVDGRVLNLTKGWSTFMRENHLVEGDVCVFELIQAKDDVLKVSIFRTQGSEETF